jgi:Domain of unknown function (DUF4037)
MADAQAKYREMLDECLPLIRGFGIGRQAIAIGGSRGKLIADHRSDVDFRLYADEIRGGASYTRTAEWGPFVQVVEQWRARGIEIDYVWARTIGEIDAALEAWLDGQVRPDDCDWAVWGYHLLTDLYHQQAVEDPHGVVAGWKERLRVYPSKLKAALLARHLGLLRYWRADYHYANKVERGDVVFLASLSARLAHDIMQVLFALNETYYPGDGNNLAFASQFTRLPPRFAERVAAALYPAPADDGFARQRSTLVELIDDVERLAAEAQP